MRKQNKPRENFEGLRVKVYDNKVEQAIKRFKQKVKDSGLLIEIKERSHYTKKSEKRRQAKKLGIIRQLTKQRLLDKKRY